MQHTEPVVAVPRATATDSNSHTREPPDLDETAMDPSLCALSTAACHSHRCMTSPRLCYHHRGKAGSGHGASNLAVPIVASHYTAFASSTPPPLCPPPPSPSASYRRAVSLLAPPRVDQICTMPPLKQLRCPNHRVVLKAGREFPGTTVLIAVRFA
ncbi:Os08g0336401 [Oryza sativa Japonica Group]|uniref:Os08g0336401 protein n=1 Tax=Oryza sativa subsp. japonica TaxID=39947 RepID=A0A0N7KPP2_ORYSJ|nr:Os08g0336401 [Oryza sativa Japonica Group]